MIASSLFTTATRSSPLTTATQTCRLFSTSSYLASNNTPTGFFKRPAGQVPIHSPHNSLAVREARDTKVARPHTPPGIPKEQAPNYPTTWSETQNPRDQAMSGPRFEQINVEYQPQPLSAMEMIQREPIRLTTSRIAKCDGGESDLAWRACVRVCKCADRHYFHSHKATDRWDTHECSSISTSQAQRHAHTGECDECTWHSHA